MSKNNQQSDSFDDELLSAYVDGELTGEQLAQVEQRLVDDPQSQQLVDELRALSTSLQTLPRLAVGEDLRAEVMQQAEQAMLLGGGDARATLRSETGPYKTSTTRRWIWAVAALAATVFLSLYLPATDQQEDLNVAQTQPAAEPPLSVTASANLEDKLADDGVSEEKEETSEIAALDTDTIVGELSADKTSEAFDLVADSSLAREARGASKEIRAESAMSARENRPRAPAEMIAADGSAAGVASGASLPSDDDVRFSCQVHLVFNDNPDNFARFDETMFANRIVVENESGDKLASGGGYGAGVRGFGGELETRAKKNDGDEEGSDEATPSSESVVVAQRGQRREFKTENRAVQEELIMVELPVDQFEQLLSDFNADRGNYVSVRVVDEADVAATKKLEKKDLQRVVLDHLQQYNRGVEQLETPELRALKSRASRMFSQSRQASTQKGKQQQIKPQRGRALRLNSQQYHYAANGDLNVDQTWLNRNFKNQSIAKAKKITKSRRSSSPQDPIQVLIILQQTLPPIPPGEPASAGSPTRNP